MDGMLIWVLTFALAAADPQAGRLIRSPGEYLESKVREGLAKGVEPARILETIRRRREDFRAAAGALDRAFREGGKDPLEGEARWEAVLELQRAADLGLPRESVLAVVEDCLRWGPRGRTEAELLSSAVRFAGVARGVGIPSGRVVRIVRECVRRGWGAGDFRLSSRSLLELRGREGGRFPAEEVGGWVEEEMGRAPSCAAAWERVRGRLESRGAAPR